MKKICFTFFSISMLGFMASCSNQGAYSDEEKKAQDDTDRVRQDSGFSALEKMAADSTHKNEAKKPGDGKGMIRPDQLPGNQEPAYTPPAPDKHDPSQPPPEPPIQQPRK